MIRRESGSEFLLIAQDAHARLSGELASHFGNGRFAPPAPRAEALAAVSLHDCGWVLHDDCPTLDEEGLPVDVFHGSIELSLRMWTESVERAGRESPYTQLLVSLHVFGLSAIASVHPRAARERFAINQFQHQEIERQESLRRGLGLRTDMPLKFGLAMNDDDPREAQLRHNHNLIQIMDRISLGLCCTELRFPSIENVTVHPGPERVTLAMERVSSTSLVVDPWPFDAARIDLSVSYRAVPARRYENNEELCAIYTAAPLRNLGVSVLPRAAGPVATRGAGPAGA